MLGIHLWYLKSHVVLSYLLPVFHYKPVKYVTVLDITIRRKNVLKQYFNTRYYPMCIVSLIQNKSMLIIFRSSVFTPVTYVTFHCVFVKLNFDDKLVPFSYGKVLGFKLYKNQTRNSVFYRTRRST